MTWTDFFLACFAAGLTFSIVSFVAGSLHLHWPHFHVHLGSAAPKLGARVAGPVNIGTIAAFLAWFGGAGYLVTRYSSVWVWVAVGVATLSGFAGAAVVFLFLARVLMRRDEPLDPADYEMVGVLGRVTSTIRASGTGEMIFSQAGARRAIAARSENGGAIPKGAEVVVTRYERGVAYVRLWEELAKTATQDMEGL